MRKIIVLVAIAVLVSCGVIHGASFIGKCTMDSYFNIDSCWYYPHFTRKK